MPRIPETFRCHVMIRGKQCPCDMTMANTFTYFLPTLDRKAREAGKHAADVETLEKNAICPWHARYFARIRRDIARMDSIASLFNRRKNEERNLKAVREELNARNEKLHRRFLAHQPALGAALIQAGIRT